MSVPSPPNASSVGAPPSANHIAIAPGSTARVRGPITVAVLAIVTLGIYVLFWWYFINREMADYGRARSANELGDSPTKSVLALFPGGLVVVPAIWTTVTTFQRIQAAQRLNGQTPINGWLGFVLFLVFSPALYGYMQSGLNSAWRATADAS
jgi:low temperature requirement protein LtrA